MKDFVSSQSTNNVRSGTLTHIPPEHWENPHLRKTETFDVYGFGILLWEITTEERPFKNAAEALMISVWVMNGHRPDETKVPDTVPSEFIEIMIECWNQKPKERPTFAIVEEKLTSLKENVSWICNYDQLEQLSDLNVIGAGAYGKVYIAYHSDWKAVAYKEVLSSDVEMSEIQRGELIAEALIQTKLEHPNVLKLLGLISQQGHVGFVMPYMMNGDVGFYLSQNNVDWGTKSRFCAEISSGMKCLHNQKPPIIHGDLKMKNVLVSADVTAVICDFGFSQTKDFVSSQSANNVRSGTTDTHPT